jgi:hypothetical protein
VVNALDEYFGTDDDGEDPAVMVEVLRIRDAMLAAAEMPELALAGVPAALLNGNGEAH